MALVLNSISFSTRTSKLLRRVFGKRASRIQQVLLSNSIKMKLSVCFAFVALCIVSAAISVAGDSKVQLQQQEQVENQNQQQPQQQQYEEQLQQQQFLTEPYPYRQQANDPMQNQQLTAQQQQLYDRLQRQQQQQRQYLQQQQYEQQLSLYQQQQAHAPVGVTKMYGNSRSGTQQAKPSTGLTRRIFEFFASPRIDGTMVLNFGGKIIFGTLLSVALVYLGVFLYGYITGNSTVTVSTEGRRFDQLGNITDLYHVAQQVYDAIEKFQEEY